MTPDAFSACSTSAQKRRGSAVVGVQRHPRHRALGVRRRGPTRQQHGLAPARRRHHQGQRPGDRLVEPIQQPRSRHRPMRQARHHHLRRHHAGSAPSPRQGVHVRSRSSSLACVGRSGYDSTPRDEAATTAGNRIADQGSIHFRDVPRNGAKGRASWLVRMANRLAMPRAELAQAGPTVRSMTGQAPVCAGHGHISSKDHIF